MTRTDSVSYVFDTGEHRVPMPGVSTLALRERREALTLRVYAEKWLDTRIGYRDRTYEAYAARLDQHILPRLGNRPIGDITVQDLTALIEKLDGLGYAGKTVHSIMMPLIGILANAELHGVIPLSPVRQLGRGVWPAAHHQERRILNSDEIRRLLDAASPQHRTLLATAIFTGLRQGELLALRWRHIDFEDGFVQVRIALDRHRNDAPLKTKNALRDVVLIPSLAARLEERQQETLFPAPDAFVFGTKDGKALHWRNVSRDALKPALQRAELGHVRWHDLRHTFASLLIAAGANVVYASRQLGHASPDTTLRVYAHLFDIEEQGVRTRNALQGLIPTP